MQMYKSHENQSWIDISIHLYGKADHAYTLALFNSCSITENIPAGTLIKCPQVNDSNQLVLLSMSSNKSIPATAWMEDKLLSDTGGIGKMIINQTFIVKSN